jgi:hypothetical protein
VIDDIIAAAIDIAMNRADLLRNFIGHSIRKVYCRSPESFRITGRWRNSAENLVPFFEHK